jgi:TrmH family RNA methyltransferase
VDSTNPPPDAPLPTSRFSVVLVEPQFRDNVGHAARAMLNFGLGDLVLVRAPPVDTETRNRAVHAQAVLDAARHVASLEDVRKEFDHVVGFAARIATINKAHSRLSESLPDVARRLEAMGGRVALVFGREDFGLSNEDVARCDQLCTIPTDRAYRSMNLSHAVSVALYEITRPEHAKMPYVSMATPHEKEILFRSYRHLNAALGFQDYRVEQADLMFRRVIGRSGLTSWEYHRLMGTISRQLKTLGKWPPPGVGGGAYTEHEAAEDGPREG